MWHIVKTRTELLWMPTSTFIGVPSASLGAGCSPRTEVPAQDDTETRMAQLIAGPHCETFHFVMLTSPLPVLVLLLSPRAGHRTARSSWRSAWRDQRPSCRNRPCPSTRCADSAAQAERPDMISECLTRMTA